MEREHALLVLVASARETELLAFVRETRNVGRLLLLALVFGLFPPVCLLLGTYATGEEYWNKRNKRRSHKSPSMA